MKLAEGQVAVVTGAANGIGRALAGALAARGLRVVLADLDKAALERVADEIGGGAVVVPTDVSDAEQVRALAERTIGEFGRVDLVFNNAGVAVGGPSWLIGTAEWNRAWAVNVGGVVNGIDAFVPHLVAAGAGHVVNTASLAGLMSGPFSAPYAASKHAVVAISESLQAELAILSTGVGVTVVCPGPVDTPMLRAMMTPPEPGAPRAAWTTRLTEEQRERLERLLAQLTEMMASVMPADRAAEIILDAVEAEKLYVTTHPEMALLARDRIDTVLTEFGAPERSRDE